MRRLAASFVIALPLAACAVTPERRVEVGVPVGALGVAAIDRGDLARAEQLLRSSTLERGDPARLINLGYVYMEQGRRGEAIKAWRAALDAPHHRMIETLGGREMRTDQLAREVLARYSPAVASAE